MRICDRYLVWDAAFPAAAPEQAGLSWNFYWCQYTEGHIAPRWLPLSIELDGGYAEPDRTHNNPLAQAVLDALSRGDTSAYRTDTDNFLTLRMADYADTLPFEVDADTFTIGESRVVSSASEVTDLFRAYFSIPTPDGLQMEITLHAAQDGTIPFLSFEPDDALTLSSPSLSNGSGLYFTLCAQGELAWELDPSQIPGGWGLYRFDGTDIETVWSLPEGERPANFWSDGEDFFFLSRDREGAYLYLLDPETFTQEGRLTLFPLDAAAPNPAFYLDGEEGFLAVASTGRLALLTRENGDWNPAPTPPSRRKRAAPSTAIWTWRTSGPATWTGPLTGHGWRSPGPGRGATATPRCTTPGGWPGWGAIPLPSRTPTVTATSPTWAAASPPWGPRTAPSAVPPRGRGRASLFPPFVVD